MSKLLLVKSIVVGTCFCGVLGLVGCGSSSSTIKYPRSQANRTNLAELGTVIRTNSVIIDGQKSYVGMAAGGVIGGGVGQTAGSGEGQILAAAAGSAVGVIVGPIVEEYLTRKKAQEMTIEMNDGSVKVIVQEINKVPFYEGETVRVVVAYNGQAYVSHYDSEAPIVDEETAAYLPEDFEMPTE